MTKNFKMAVTSLSFLIGGSALFIYGIKQSKKKEIKPGIKVNLDDYIVQLPSEYSFSNTEGPTFIYKRHENETIIMYINEFNDIYDDMSDERLHKTMKDTWLRNGEKEMAFDYNEGKIFKSSYYAVSYLENGLDLFGQFITIIDRYQRKILSFNFFLNECTEENCTKVISEAFELFENFLRLNYLHEKEKEYV